MKIIAHIGNDRVLVEAGTQEIARIIGLDGTSSLDEKDARIDDPRAYRWERQFKIGTEIAVSPMWDWMKKAREQLEKITSTAKLVAGISEMLEHAPPAALVEPEEPNA